jgi:hypothetical protein
MSGASCAGGASSAASWRPSTIPRLRECGVARAEHMHAGHACRVCVRRTGVKVSLDVQRDLFAAAGQRHRACSPLKVKVSRARPQPRHKRPPRPKRLPCLRDNTCGHNLQRRRRAPARPCQRHLRSMLRIMHVPRARAESTGAPGRTRHSACAACVCARRTAPAHQGA